MAIRQPKQRKAVTLRDVAMRAGVSEGTVSRVVNKIQKVSASTQAKVERAIQDLGYQAPGILGVTLKSIAAETGVSECTVSRALNNAPGVRIDTRRKVRETAMRLGYPVPPESPREIYGPRPKTRHTLTIRLVQESLTGLPSIALIAFRDLVDGIEKGLGDQGQLSIHNVRPDSGLQTDLFPVNGTDGVILDCSFGRVDQMVWRSQLPCVHTQSLDMSVAYHRTFVATDNTNGVNLLVNHLVELGHRHIAMISTDWDAYYRIERHRAFRNAMFEHGLPAGPDSILTVNTQEHSIHREHAEDLMLRLFARRPKPTAVIDADGYFAIEALAWCRDNRIRVPEDISVAAFLEGGENEPSVVALTRVAPNLVARGEIAARELLALIHEPGYAPRQIIPPARLHGGKTTGPPRAAEA